MSVLPIYLYGTKVLKAKAKPVKELNNMVIKLVYDMVETMAEANGIGLAATQVGDLHRVVVIDISDVDERKNEESNHREAITSPDLPRKVIMINPEVLEAHGSWNVEEGCLSIPDVRGEVERAAKIKVKFRDANFGQVELSADGLLARVMLHEIDHLDGILFTERLSGPQRMLLKGELRKIKEGNVETSYPVITADEE
jgi:peptide deformylase